MLLLQSLAKSKSKVVVITCGLQRIWAKIMAKAGLDIPVIGADRLRERLIVHPKLKGDLVDHLRRKYRMTVWAFGEQRMDLPMLENADHDLIVVGKENLRDQRMEKALENSILFRGLKARQLLIPSTVKPRLDEELLSIVTPSQSEIFRVPLGSFRRRHQANHAAARLLSTPMRSNSVSGPALREAHHQAGRHFAQTLIAEAIGTEPLDGHDVHGSLATGWRLKNERRTTIIAMMPDGEPLAKGIHDVFPCASFAFHKEKEDLQGLQLQDQTAVILVHAVVHSGKTLMGSIEWIHQGYPHININVAAAVVPSGFFSSQICTESLSRVRKEMNFVFLSRSDNKPTGTGFEDTGSRLFNTTHLV